MSSWILVADSAHARIFNAETAKSELSEIDRMIHPEAQLHEQKLTSDLPGSQAGGATGSHHSVGGKPIPKSMRRSNLPDIYANTLKRHIMRRNSVS